MGGWGWVEITRIKAVLSSTGLELELELSLAKNYLLHDFEGNFEKKNIPLHLG